MRRVRLVMMRVGSVVGSFEFAEFSLRTIRPGPLLFRRWRRGVRGWGFAG